jgi:hypothetical protein
MIAHKFTQEKTLMIIKTNANFSRKFNVSFVKITLEEKIWNSIKYLNALKEKFNAKIASGIIS